MVRQIKSNDLASEIKSSHQNAKANQNKQWLRLLQQTRIEIASLLARKNLLQSYMAQDPTLVHYQLEWQYLSDRFSVLYAGLNDARKLIESRIGEGQSSVSLTQVLNLQARIVSYLPIYFEEQLTVLTDRLNQSFHIHAELAQMQSNPFFIAACRSDRNIKAKFLFLQSQSILGLVNEISDHSRHLFLQMPYSEMINTKSAQCPNYLNISVFFNQLYYFVINDVLSHESANERVATLSHWINVAQGLYEVGDFSSLKAICSALTGSIPLYRLAKTKAGLSQENRDMLQKLGDFLNNAVRVNEETERRKNRVIPYLGTYRTALERAKASDSLQAKQHIATQLTALQVAVGGEQVATAANSPILKWANNVVPEKNDMRELEIALVKKARQYEPKNSDQLASSLLHYQKNCWLNKLRNRELADVLLHEQLVFSNDVTQNQINRLNDVVNVKLSNSEFNVRLGDAGIYLDEQVVNILNQQNRQLFYLGLIENTTLKNCLASQHIHNNQLGSSTRESIVRINKRLRRGVSPYQLTESLKAIGVELNQAEMWSVLQQSNARRDLANLPEVELLIDETRQLLSSLASDAELKAQMKDYMILLDNSDDLSAYDKENLIKEFTCVIKGDGTRYAGHNPFLDQFIRLNSAFLRFEELKKSLTDNPHDKKLVKQMAELARMRFDPAYSRLFNSFNLIKLWASNNGEPCSVLKNLISYVAPMNIVAKLKLKLGLHEKPDYLDDKLAVVCRRTAERLKPSEFQLLINKVKGELASTENALTQASCAACFDSEALVVLQQLQTAINNAASVSECQNLREQFQQLSATYENDIKAYKAALQKYLDSEDDVAKQWLLCTSIVKYDPSVDNAKVDDKYLTPLREANFAKKMGRGRLLTSSYISPAELQSKFPGLNVEAITLIHKSKTVGESLQRKEESLLKADAEVSQENTESKSTAAPKSKLANVAKITATVAGGAVVAVVAVKLSPLIVGALVIKSAAGLIGVKIGVGAVGAAAGATAGNKVEGAVEKRFFRRISLFSKQQKNVAEVEDLQNSQQQKSSG